MSKEKDNAQTVVKVKNKFPVIVLLIVMVISFILGFIIEEHFFKKDIKVAMVTEQIKTCSDLTTATSTFSGEVEYNKGVKFPFSGLFDPKEEGYIPFVDKKHFTMSYVAKIRAGIDLKRIKIKIDGKTVKVRIPHAKIQDISFIESGFKFHNRYSAILNWQKYEDVIEACETLAEPEAKKAAKKSKVLMSADNEVKKQLTKLLAFVEAADYNLEISFIDGK